MKIFAACLILALYSLSALAASETEGIAMYSWKDKNDAWVFTFLPLSEPDKPDKEIVGSKVRIEGTKNLTLYFQSLPKKTKVYWRFPTKRFYYPETGYLEIFQQAYRAEIEFHGPVLK